VTSARAELSKTALRLLAKAVNPTTGKLSGLAVSRVAQQLFDEAPGQMRARDILQIVARQAELLDPDWQ